MVFWNNDPTSDDSGSVATDDRASVAEQRLEAVLELVRQAHRQGAISRAQLTQVERAAGIEPPAPKTVTITLQVTGDTGRLTDGSDVGTRIEYSLSTLASSAGMEIVRGSTTVDVG